MSLTQTLAHSIATGKPVACPNGNLYSRHSKACICEGKCHLLACSSCQGSGWSTAFHKRCSDCGGKGYQPALKGGE